MDYTLWLAVSSLCLQAFVKADQSAPTDTPSKCSLPTVAQKRPCNESHTYWTYEPEIEECWEDRIFGCGISGIFLKSANECEETCRARRKGNLPSVCSQEPTVENDYCGPVTYVWSYDSFQNACQEKAVEGCEVTGNAFYSKRQCERACSQQAIPCEKVQCDVSLYEHYIQKGCKPEYLDEACCPTSFDCPDPSVFDSKCFHDGKFYEIGQSVPDVTPCRKNCVCQLETGKENKTQIICTNVYCPGKGVRFPKKKFCRAIHESADECCASRYVNCEPFNATAIMTIIYEFDLPSSNETRLPLCFWDGVEYVEGERFYPKTADSPCQVCTCTPEFSGIYGPGCKTTTCKIQPLEPDCVPVYDEAVCCPTRYKCPSEFKEITIKVTSSEQKTVEKDSTNTPGETTDKVPELKDESKGFSFSGDVCKEEPFVGPCRGQVPRFFYNHTAKECQTFLFGGCEAKENNFRRRYDCEVGCLLPLADSRTGLQLSEDCTQPKVLGFGLPPRTRFFYDQKMKKCRMFHYFGKGEHQNTFMNIEDCHTKCEDLTQLLESRSKNDSFITNATAPYCLFGGVKFNLGQQLATNEECVECTCVTPPELTCIRRKSFCPDILPENDSLTSSEERKKVPSWQEVPVTKEITELAFSHKTDIEKELGFALQAFQPIKYKEDWSEGRKFFITVRYVAFFTEKEEMIIVLIKKNLNGTTEVIIHAKCTIMCGPSDCHYSCF